MAVDPELRRAVEAMQPAELDDLQALIGVRRKGFGVAGESGRVRHFPVARAWTLRDAVIWSLATLLLFFAVDGLVFHSGWYMSYLEPNSSAGQLESQVFWLRHEPEKTETAVFGDSRIGEGFSARAARAASGDTVQFRNMGVAGSTPRVWYYLLRDADPERKRFSTVVFGIDHYADVDGEDQANRIGDLNYVVGRLRLTDCPEFAFSFHSEFRSRVLSGCLLRGIPLRDDLHALLEKPSVRFAAAKDWRNKGHGYLDGYGGKPEDVAGLTVDYAARKISYPPGLKDWQRDTVRGTLLPDPVPQVGILRDYRRKWLGKIVDFYAGSKTRVVFLELPRGPLPPMESGVPAYVMNELKRRPNVVVLPAETFHELERPELFADGLHLNHAGRPLFSEKLARALTAGAGAR
jgi:hypothetical protein